MNKTFRYALILFIEMSHVCVVRSSRIKKDSKLVKDGILTVEWEDGRRYVTRVLYLAVKFSIQYVFLLYPTC